LTNPPEHHRIEKPAPGQSRAVHDPLDATGRKQTSELRHARIPVKFPFASGRRLVGFFYQNKVLARLEALITEQQ